jgi:SRSO17 transposase
LIGHISVAPLAPSGRKPGLNLAPRDVTGLKQKLEAYHRTFAGRFKRQEQRHWAHKYLEGQLLDLERKAIEPMAHALEEGNIQAMQQFISCGAWSDAEVLELHQAEVAATLGRPDGVLILDGCDFPKQGADSVGVARQYCGPLGKLANCQASVVLAYASEVGHTLLDRRLYLPKEWFDEAHQERWHKCGIPEDVTFQTKPELGWAMVEAVLQRGAVPFQWVAMDEGFGRATHLLNHIHSANKYFFAEIACNTRAWRHRPKVVPPGPPPLTGRPPTLPRLAPGAPAAQRVDQLAWALPRKQWQRCVIHEGTKGPMVVEIAAVRVVMVEEGLPGREEWLVIRRPVGQAAPTAWKYYRCNAPQQTPFKTLARLTGWRWPVETTIEECKGELGFDHYEVRGWVGWHHHTTMTLLAHHFLVRLRVEMGAEAPALTVSQVRQLLQVVLPKREFDEEGVLAEIERIQRQNYAAYLSHRKRHLHELRRLKPK